MDLNDLLVRFQADGEAVLQILEREKKHYTPSAECLGHSIRASVAAAALLADAERKRKFCNDADVSQDDEHVAKKLAVSRPDAEMPLQTGMMSRELIVPVVRMCVQVHTS